MTTAVKEHQDSDAEAQVLAAEPGGQIPSQLYVPGQGNVYTAVKDTAPPADTTTPPTAGVWFDHGFTTEDGVTFGFARTVDNLKGWQSLDSLRTITTELLKTCKFTLMQSNEPNLKLALGGGTVAAATGIYTPPDPTVLDVRAIFIVANDGGNKWGWYAPRCILNANVDFQWHKLTATELPLEFSVEAAAPGTPPYQFYFPLTWNLS
jgi:hypothetical protein